MDIVGSMSGTRFARSAARGAGTMYDYHALVLHTSTIRKQCAQAQRMREYRLAGSNCRQVSVKLWNGGENFRLINGWMASVSALPGDDDGVVASHSVCASHSCGTARPCSLSSSI